MCYDQDPLRIPGEQNHHGWKRHRMLCAILGSPQRHKRKSPIRRDARLLPLTTILLLHNLDTQWLFIFLTWIPKEPGSPAKQAVSNFHLLLASHTYSYETPPLLKKHV